MTILRLFAIAFILIVSTIAWFVLGASVTARSGESDQKLAAEVAQLWGGPHRQVAPAIAVERPREIRPSSNTSTVPATQPQQAEPDPGISRDNLPITSSRIDVGLALQHRQKGLLWYDTFTVKFQGRYSARNPDSVPRTLVAHFPFPSKDALYDGLVVSLNGTQAPALSTVGDGVDVRAIVQPGADATLDVAYQSRGLDSWRYAFAANGVNQVQNLQLRVTTDFDAVDFPAGTVSPTTNTPVSGGRQLDWTFASLVTGQSIGIDLPDKTNPGPLAARITFFAPVSLLFFTSVLVILGVLTGQNLHPMNYAFIAAAFFAFHLLLAYLVDHVQIHVAFVSSAVTSIFLVVSYLRIVAGTPFALAKAGIAQLVFLVLFSYAFFFEGFTGLTVTVGAIVTLFILMQLTARVDWSKALTLDVPGVLRRT